MLLYHMKVIKAINTDYQVTLSDDHLEQNFHLAVSDFFTDYK